MSLNREKRGHFNKLRAASHLEADLALLKSINPNHPLLNGTPVKSNKLSDDILIALLGLTCYCDIVAYRRKFAKEKTLESFTSDKLQEKKEDAEADTKIPEDDVLTDREAELNQKESELSDKESELEDKESELFEKETELSAKEAELDNKASAEKKSVSKKKSTRK